VRKNYQRGDHNASVGRAQRKDYACSNTRELTDKFHTLVGAVEQVHKAYVAQDEPHVSVGGLLDAHLVRRKGYFWKTSMKGRKDSWKEKQHVRGKHVRHACKQDLTMLGLGFL
jgi:hypothetical protein